MTKETVGKVSSDLLKSAYKNDHSAHDQMREMLTDYEFNINKAVQSGIKTYKGDFYIVVLIKKERLMSNVMRLFYFARQSCPTPQHEQVVYHYHHQSGYLEFLWVVPSLEACVILHNEALLAHPDERQLVNFVLDFKSGALFTRAQMLNGELETKEFNGTNKSASGLIA